MLEICLPIKKREKATEAFVYRVIIIMKEKKTKEGKKKKDGMC